MPACQAVLPFYLRGLALRHYLTARVREVKGAVLNVVLHVNENGAVLNVLLHVNEQRQAIRQATDRPDLTSRSNTSVLRLTDGTRVQV